MPDARPRYPVQCPHCAHEFLAAQSISMEMGSNHGWCACPRCDTSLHLQFDAANERMSAEPWAARLAAAGIPTQEDSHA